MLQRSAVLLAIFLLAIVVGCGSNRPATENVRGKVTFDGSPPPAEGMVNFAMVEPAEGHPRRSGSAKFDTSGEYTASTFETGDGLVPGTYIVRVECWKEPPTMQTPGVSYVPKTYQVDLVVSPGGGSVTLDLNVPAENAKK